MITKLQEWLKSRFQDDDDSPAPPPQNGERRGPVAPPPAPPRVNTRSSDDADDSFDRDWEPSAQDVRDFREAHGDRRDVDSGDVDPRDVGLPGRDEVPGAYGYGDGPDRLRNERVDEMNRAADRQRDADAAEDARQAAEQWREAA